MWFLGSKNDPASKLTPKQSVNKAVQRIEQMLGQLGLTVVEGDAVMRMVVLPVRHTYRVKLNAWPDEDFNACLVASIDYRVDRDLILRELAIELLEENHVLQNEAFILIPRADHDRLIGCRRVLPLATTSNSELVLACTSLLERMERMVARLYAKGLIPSGPSGIND